MPDPTKLEIALVAKLGGSVTLGDEDFLKADRLRIRRLENRDGTVTLLAIDMNQALTDARFQTIEGRAVEVKPKPPAPTEPSRGRDFTERHAPGFVDCTGCGARVNPSRPCAICNQPHPDGYGGL